MEDTLTIDTANNAPLSRYLARSENAHLQWVTRLPCLPWIQAHLKTVEGRALLALHQAWPIWTLLQPDDEHLQLTRVLVAQLPATVDAFRQLCTSTVTLRVLPCWIRPSNSSQWHASIDTSQLDTTVLALFSHDSLLLLLRHDH